MKQLIQRLTEVSGPSGYEQDVRAVVRAEIEGLGADVRVDALGNLIARLGQKAEGGLRVMLSAHMDEIGLIVTHVDENGFARFSNIGGVYPLHCVGARVVFLNGTRGLIYMERLDPSDRLPALDALYIDTGATDKASSAVKVGDLAVFDRPFLDLGQRVVAKAMDDRVSVAVMIETMRALQGKSSPHELVFVFSTQEEVGLRGATTAAYGIDPDLGLAVDVTRTGDIPKGVKMEVSLGKGPAVKVRDSGMLSDPRLVRWMAETAEKAGIPYQMEVLEAGTTDARAIQLTRAGVPSICLSIPTRYIHSPSEMVDMDDVNNAVKLLVALLTDGVPL